MRFNRRRKRQTTNSTAGARTPSTIVVAYAADGGASGSVPRTGYRLTKALDDIEPVMLIAHRRDRRALADVPQNQIRFAGSATFAALTRALSTRLFPGAWGLISILDVPDYLLFDLHAYLIAKRLTSRRQFEYLLRVNPVSFRLPSVLPRLPLPVFTGPHNGGMAWPPGFEYIDKKERTGQRFRSLGATMHQLYGDSRRYARIFVAHDLAAATVPRDDRGRTIFMPDDGVDRVWEVSPAAGDARKLLFVGRLTPFKALDFAIRALDRLPESVTLTIVGDGPQRAELEALARTTGVDHRCTFVGEVPHAAVHDYYARAGMLVLPSVRQAGGSVVLEAMSHGLPCLVARWGGPYEYTKQVGVHLSVASPAALEQSLVDAVQRFLADPEAARALGMRSRAVIQGEFEWTSKARRLRAVMVDVSRALRPERE